MKKTKPILGKETEIELKDALGNCSGMSEYDEGFKAGQEELLKDMKSQMYHWHGRGNKMIDDYQNIKIVKVKKSEINSNGSVKL